MKLYGMQTEGDGEILEILWIRMIDENPNDIHEWRKLFDDLRGLCRLDVSRTAGIKIQSDGMRTK